MLKLGFKSSHSSVMLKQWTIRFCLFGDNILCVRSLYQVYQIYSVLIGNFFARESYCIFRSEVWSNLCSSLCLLGIVYFRSNGKSPKRVLHLMSRAFLLVREIKIRDNKISSDMVLLCQSILSILRLNSWCPRQE